MPDTNSHTATIERLLSALRQRHVQLKRENSLATLFTFISVVLAGFTLLLLAESLVYLPAGFKGLFWVLLVLLGLFTARRLYNVRQPDFTRFYRTFCDCHGFRNLENGLDLYLDNSPDPSKFHLFAIERSLRETDQKDIDEHLRSFVANRRQHRVYIYSLLTVIVAGLLSGTSIYFEKDAALRAISFWNTYEKPNPYTFVIHPEDATLEHGTTFSPEIEFTGTGTLPRQVSLSIKTDVEEEYRHRQMELSADHDRTYHPSPIELTSDATWFVSMDGFESVRYSLEVRMRPRFEVLNAYIEPPSYTGLPADTVGYPFARLQAYGGSEITFEGSTNKPVREIMVRADGREKQMNPEDEDSTRFRTSFTLTEGADRVDFVMSDRDGLANRNLFRFSLNLLEDEYPSVIILEPSGSLTDHDPVHLDILYRVADDFGLTRAFLHWELKRAFTAEPTTGSKTLPQPVIGEIAHIPWRLEDLDLRPRDRLTFWVTAWDNDGYNGYKYIESQRLTLDVPSLSAYLEEINHREEQVQNLLENISETYQRMDRDYERLRNRLIQSSEPGRNEEQIIEEMQEHHDTIEESIHRLNEEFESIRQEMESGDRVSDDTRRAYNDLRDLLEELDDPDLAQALQELRNSMQNPQDLQQAMENFEFNEQVYRERLERTLELFKALKMNSDLDKLAMQYDDLAGRMESLAGEEASQSEQLDEQNGIREDMSSLRPQLDRLGNHSPERAEARLRHLRDESILELQEIREELDELTEQALETGVEDGNGDVSERQEEMAGRFRDRAGAMRDARQEMGGEQIQVNLLALRQSLYTLLELSDAQEELARRTTRTESRSQGYVDLARAQNNIRSQFSIVADTLYQVSAEIPSLSNQINRKKAEIERTLSRTIEQLTNRDQPPSVITTRESLGGINELSSMLAEVIDQLMNQQNGSGGSGMMSMQQMIEQMQNMSGDQQMMNDMLQELINDAQGERLSRDQSERMDQLARQQNRIRNQLEELQRSGALRPGDRILSEMRQMIEEMEDAINDMRGGITDPLMVERQQNILSRMLSAEESLQDRGESEEYAGQTPDAITRTTPPGITLEELEQHIRSRLNDPRYTPFTDDYQRLIQRYFETVRQYENQSLP